MKKISMILLGVLLIGTLTGCSSSTTLIKSYTDTALENKNLIIKTTQEDHKKFFAEDLVVFSKTAIKVSGTVEEAEEMEEPTPSEGTEDEISFNEDATAEEDTISSGNVLLAGMDTMEAVYGKNVFDRIYPASITKILTALLTLQHANFSDTVVFTEEMEVNEYGAKLCQFDVGDELTVEQLFKGLMVYSGNDAANALAVHIGGSIDGFSEMMNAEAKRLGCVDTHFVNPSGLHDNDHYTSAYDLYLIFNECLKYEEFK